MSTHPSGVAHAAEPIDARGEQKRARSATDAMSRATAFIGIAFARPSTIGAILPSSRHLADAMARAAAGAQRLVELGAGTGAITEALCRHHPDVPTSAVEMEPQMARDLRERFPQVQVHAAAAHEVLPDLQCRPGPTVLISSLPFRSLPPRLRLRSSLAIERFLIDHPARRLVQYTYLSSVPFHTRLGASLRWRQLEVVWRNLPPAWVWELSSNAAGHESGAALAAGAAR